MVFLLKKGATKDDIAELEKSLYSEKSSAGFNAKKYNGVLKVNDDPMMIQKQLRDEWERTFG